MEKKNYFTGRLDAKAFTLIELLVVVLIIGILAAIALPQYQKAIIKSRYANLKVVTTAIVNAVEVYYLANSSYPTSFDELSIDTPAFNSENSTSDRRTSRVFDWGNCIIYYGSKFVACQNSKIGMRYRVYFSTVGGERYCDGDGDGNSIQNQICRAETGENIPSCPDDRSYCSCKY